LTQEASIAEGTEPVMNKRYRVTLTEVERGELKAWIGDGLRPSGGLLHARILLKAD
jgi:hypothetical protein